MLIKSLFQENTILEYRINFMSLQYIHLLHTHINGNVTASNIPAVGDTCSTAMFMALLIFTKYITDNRLYAMCYVQGCPGARLTIGWYPTLGTPANPGLVHFTIVLVYIENLIQMLLL